MQALAAHAAAPAGLTSGMRGPSSRVRARRHRAGRCCQASVTLGCAVTRSLRWLPLLGRGGVGGIRWWG